MKISHLAALMAATMAASAGYTAPPPPGPPPSPPQAVKPQAPVMPESIADGGMARQ